MYAGWQVGGPVAQGHGATYVYMAVDDWHVETGQKQKGLTPYHAANTQQNHSDNLHGVKMHPCIMMCVCVHRRRLNCIMLGVEDNE